MMGRFKRLFSVTGNDAAEGIAEDRPVGVRRLAAVRDTPVLPLASIEHEYCSYLLGVNSPLDVPLNGFETQVLAGVESLLAAEEAVCDALPRLPDVLPKLMKALRDERASWEEIAQVVGQDALLVAEVLRLANSPCFRVAAKITVMAIYY
ncbi:MAG TPA: HDOD domain-containing protein [Gammaproteobacteria bacterium]|nr:HDOD domain-containing protein [Gammaproteobacteria bacterium]